MHFQYLDCAVMTLLTTLIAGREAEVAMSRSGGSPISVLVTARADLEMDRKLYPPCQSCQDQFTETSDIDHEPPNTQPPCHSQES